MAAFLIDYSSESSLSFPHDPSPFSLAVQPLGCPPSSRSRVYVSALALLSSSVSRYFSLISLRALRTVLHLSLSLCRPISLQSLGLRYLLLIPRFPSGDLSPRDARPTVLLANDLRIWSPCRGCSRANVLVPPREAAFVRDRDTVSDISFYFSSLPNVLLLRNCGASKRWTWPMPFHD